MWDQCEYWNLDFKVSAYNIKLLSQGIHECINELTLISFIA